MKKFALLILVIIGITSCRKEVQLSFSESNFTKSENAIIEINNS